MRAGAAHEVAALVRHAPDLVTLLDRDGRLCSANLALGALLGHEPAALLGRPLADLVHPDDLPLVRLTLDTALVEGGAGPPAVVRAAQADGGWRSLEVAAAPLGAGADRLVAVWRALEARPSFLETRPG